MWVVDQSNNHLLEYNVPPPACAWIVDASGNWSAAGNWTGGPPNGVNSSVQFGTAISVPRTVTVDSPVTAGTLAFNSAAAYTIAGPQAITLQSTIGDASIVVTGGTHAVSANLVLATTPT